MMVLPKISFLNKYAQKLQKNETANADSQHKAARPADSAHIYIYDVLKNNTAFKGANFGANLAPLSKDTVSFGAASQKKGAQVKSAKQTRAEKDAAVGKVRKPTKTRQNKRLDNTRRTSIHLAESVRGEVDFAYKRLKNDISSIFGMRVLDADDKNFDFTYNSELLSNISNEKPVLAIISRKKSSKSLAEKMGHMLISSKKDAIERIHDIVGVRILVSNSDKKSGEYVADKLFKAVKNGWIKISEIEIYRNPVLNPPEKYDYISEKRLDEIAAVAKKKAKQFSYSTSKTDFGYSAVHIGVDLPGGIKGEIQILSPKVAAFKEIEDICYKGLSGKGLPTGYGKLRQAFAKIDPEINKDGYDEFAAYTRQAYAYERTKRSKDKGPFLSLPEGSKIPPRLDFNNIAKMKEEIDSARREKVVRRMAEEAEKLLGDIGVKMQ